MKYSKKSKKSQIVVASDILHLVDQITYNLHNKFMLQMIPYNQQTSQLKKTECKKKAKAFMLISLIKNQNY